MEPTDTQVMPTQVYEDYLHQSRLSVTTGTTYDTGQTGHVNLIRELDTLTTNDTGHDSQKNSAAIDATSPIAVHGNTSEDEMLGPSQLHLDPITSPIALLQQTPALAGRKHGRHGNIFSPAERTPAQDLAGVFSKSQHAPTLGLSQIFGQTQAGSSPFSPHINIRSDPVFDRPSPLFGATRTSSPPAVLSSPIVERHHLARQSFAGPRANYTSVNQSQEMRERQKRMDASDADLTSSQRATEDDSWSQDSVQRRYENKIRRRQILRQASSFFAELSAPCAFPKPEARRKLQHSKTVIGLMPTRKPMNRGTVDLVSDDESMDELSPDFIHSDEPMQIDQAVRLPASTKVVLNDCEMQRPTSSPAPGRYGSAIRAPNSGREATRHKNFMQRIRRERQVVPHFVAPMSQTVAVADSQTFGNPDSQVDVPSSVISGQFISQSQGLSMSSRSKMALIETPSLSAEPRNERDSSKADLDSASVQRVVASSPPPASLSIDINLADRGVEQSGSRFPGTGSSRENAQNLPQASPSKVLQSTKAHVAPVEACQLLSTNQQPLQRKNNETVPETSPASTAAPICATENSANLAWTPANNNMSEEETNGHEMTLATPSGSNRAFDTARTHQDDTFDGDGAVSSSLEPLSGNENFATPRKKMLAIAFQRSPSFNTSAHADLNIMNDEDFEFEALVNHSRSSFHTKKSVLDFRKTDQAVDDKSDPKPFAGKVDRSQLPAVQTEQIASQEASRQKPRKVPGKLSRPSRPHKAVVDDLNASQSSGQTPMPKRTEVAETPLLHVPNKAFPQPDAREFSAPSIRPSTSFVSEVTQKDQGDTSVGSKESSTDNANNCLNRTVVKKSSGTINLTSENTSVHNAMHFPHRVLAEFKGSVAAYYPATLIGLSPHKAGHFRILFDDTSEVDVTATQVRRLELRIGDLVKVELEHLRGKTYVVVGMKDYITDLSNESASKYQTDVFGHQKVLLQIRQSPKSTLNDATVQDPPIEIPITNIYLSKRMWPAYSDRQYSHSEDPHPSNVHVQTPSNGPSSPMTPSSRSRNVVQGGGILQSNIVRKSAIQLVKQGIFCNMAFSVSHFDGQVDKDRLTQAIILHGGRILPDGFEELFDIKESSILPPEASPILENAPAFKQLALNARSAQLGFVAEISGEHSRRGKYLQALALDLPCLHVRWITDCIAKGSVLPWALYLLPAGESSYLAGAIRSRTFSGAGTSQLACAANLHDTINARPSLLKDDSVMLLMSDKQKKERVNALIFLLHALGANRVERVYNILAAKAILDCGREVHWIYVDDATDLKKARAVLSNQDFTLGKNKRRKLSIEKTRTRPKESQVKIVSNDFVAQTLIMGAIAET